MIAYLILPKNVQAAAFLSQVEREYAAQRLSGHLLAAEKERFKYVNL
jgi:hypothetical protein